MKICISSWCFHNAFENGLLSTLDFPAFCVREFGVKQIEFFDPDFFCGPTDVPNIMELSPKDPHVRAVKKACDDARVSIVAISAQNDFSHPDRHERQSDIERVSRWIDIAVALETRIIRINSGIWFSSTKDDGAPRLAGALREVAPKAKKNNVILAIENHPQDLTSVKEAKKLAEIADELAEFGVATCPDNGHILQPVWEECLETLLPAAKHCHVKSAEFDEKGEEITLDYVGFFEMAEQSRYEGSLSIELIPPPRAGPLVWLKITERTLQQLRENGVPTKVVKKLQSLKGHAFDSTAKLGAALAKCLEAEEAASQVPVVTRHVERLNSHFELRKKAVEKTVQLLLRYGATL